jgi:hypothetical protein
MARSFRLYRVTKRLKGFVYYRWNAYGTRPGLSNRATEADFTKLFVPVQYGAQTLYKQRKR